MRTKDAERALDRRYFFLSYARGDDQASVGRFYDDLCDAVRRRSGTRGGVGFLDQEIEPGDRWAERIARALARSATLVALISPTYFNSEYCGKEAAFFWDRLDRHQKLFGTRPAAFIPILWSPCPAIPDMINEVQYDHRDLDDTYRRFGVRLMVRSAVEKILAYEVLLYHLADRIVQAATGPSRLLEEQGLPDLDTVAPMFPERLVSEWPAGPDHVHFILATGTADQMRGRRQRLDYYGTGVEDWAPYHPEVRPGLWSLSQYIAGSPQRSGVGAVAVDRVVDLMAWAQDHNQIVVLLVDAWADLLPGNASAMRHYDRTRVPGSAVLIPGSGTDSEYQASADVLEAKMIAAFAGRHDDADLFGLGLTTFGEYHAKLEEVLAVAQNRIGELGRVNPGIEDGGEPPGFRTP